jgi:hypothetical protein
MLDSAIVTSFCLGHVVSTGFGSEQDPHSYRLSLWCMVANSIITFCRMRISSKSLHKLLAAESLLRRLCAATSSGASLRVDCPSRVLCSNMRRHDSAMNTSGLSSGHKDQREHKVINSLGLDVLGVCCSSALNKLDFALVRYRQHFSNGPLHVELLQVRP